MHCFHSNFESRLPRVVLCAALSAAFSAAHAGDETSPYYVGVSQTETADSNVFRSRKGTPSARDLISTSALLAGLDQALGRGRLGLNLQLNASNFLRNKQLNYTGTDASARLEWETLHHISGTFAAHHRQTLYSSDPAQSTLVTERDVLRDRGVGVNARMGLATLLSLDGGWSYNQARHSSEFQSQQDLNQTSGHLGLRVRPNDLWSVRLGLRETQAKLPRYTPTLADEITRHDIDLSADWNLSGASKLDARLSSTRENHSYPGARNGSLWTGRVGHTWNLTGKSSLRTQLSRDSDVGATDSELRLTSTPTGEVTLNPFSNDTKVRTSVLVQGKWEASAKVTANLGYSYSQRKLERLSGLSSNSVSSVQDRDVTHGLTLGLNYHPTRKLELGCKASHEARNPDSAQAQITYAYEVTTGACYLQFLL